MTGGYSTFLYLAALTTLIGSGAFAMLGRHASSPRSAAPQTQDIVEV